MFTPHVLSQRDHDLSPDFYSDSDFDDCEAPDATAGRAERAQAPGPVAEGARGRGALQGYSLPQYTYLGGHHGGQGGHPFTMARKVFTNHRSEYRSVVSAISIIGYW